MVRKTSETGSGRDDGWLGWLGVTVVSISVSEKSWSYTAKYCLSFFIHYSLRWLRLLLAPRRRPKAYPGNEEGGRAGMTARGPFKAPEPRNEGKLKKLP